MRGWKNKTEEEWKTLFEKRVGWSRVVMFTSTGSFTVSNIPVDQGFQNNVMLLYEDRTKAIAEGLALQGDLFTIYRWHPPVIFGRRGEPRETEGIAVLRGKSSGNGQLTFLVVTYKLPFLASRIIPLMKNFFSTYIGEIESTEPTVLYRNLRPENE